MSSRFVIKITGAAGQGIKTSGLVLAKALKKSGFCTYGYTEYPSLIRGGHNIFQIDVSTDKIASMSDKLHVLLALDQNSIKLRAKEIHPGGALIFDSGTCTINPELEQELKDKDIQVFGLKLLDLTQSVGGTGIMKNTVTLGAVWSALGLDLTILNEIMGQYFNKTAEILDLNIKSAKQGYDSINLAHPIFPIQPKPELTFHDDMIISGNEAIGLGAIAAGVKLYSSYPMTPASSILTFLAENGTKYGMVVKQAEDEITAVNMVIGSYYAGARSMCGTSGGGFDLMTEAVSLAGITETPLVIVLGQRPGPATGVPTWTTQGDLNLAIHAGHGEFPRIVMAVSDADDSFFMTAEAHNLAEKFQTPVILLTDKHIGESFYSTPQFDQSKITIERGKLIKPGTEEQKTKFRYEITDDGISDRWLPGDKIATFLANSDEHTPKGYSTEEGPEIAAMMSKRARKIDTILKALPDPQLLLAKYDKAAKTLVITWGSNKPTLIDVQNEFAIEQKYFDILNIQYMWPLKADKIKSIFTQYENVVVMEVNQTGQLANLIESQTLTKLSNRILKFDGRPYTFEETMTILADYVK